MNVRDVMTPNPEMIQSSDTVQKAAELMKDIDVGIVPVFEGDSVVGMLTDRDITVRLVAEGKDPTSAKAGDIMTKDVISCTEDTDAQEAAKIMEDKQIRRLLVTDSQGRVSGVVSLGDLAVSLSQETAGEVIKEVSQPSKPER